MDISKQTVNFSNGFIQNDGHKMKHLKNVLEILRKIPTRLKNGTVMINIITY